MLSIKSTSVASAFAVLVLCAACASKPVDVAAQGEAATPQLNVQAANAGPNGIAMPARIVPGSLEDFREKAGENIFFNYDAFDLTPDSMATLDKQANWLSSYPGVTITVEGHCDERGTREYNIALGARRASAVREYLVSKGVNFNRVETVSYGKERPICVGSVEACWAQNRQGVSVPKNGATS